MDALVLSPHSDDGDLAMGGTIAKLVREKNTVRQVCMIAGTYKNTQGAVIDWNTRRAEFFASQKVLGTTSPIMGPFAAENAMTTQPIGELVAYIDELVRDYTPDRVYVPLPWFNQDHTVVWEAACAAMRRSFDPVWLAYEMPGQTWPVFPQPQLGWHYEVLEPTDMMKKEAALKSHVSQNLQGGDGPVSIRSVYSLLLARGHEVGELFAERFYLIRGKKS